MTQQETNELFIQVLATARLMRAAQRRYFKQRDNLNECKRLEAELDRLISEPPATNNQPELFQ